MADPKPVKGALSSELRIGILGISVDPASREKLAAMASQMAGAYVVDNLGPHITAREAMRLLEPFQYRVCVLDLDDDPEEGARVGRRLRDGCDSSVNLFAACSDAGPERILGAMRCGCSEYLLKPLDAERLLEAFSRIEARRQTKVQMEKGRLVTVMGAKGGTGVTSLASHLALNLAQKHQQRCLLVDQHPTLGDVSLYLGLRRHQYSFYELVHNTDRLDADLLQGFVSQHASGLHVLDSPEAIQAFPHASPDAVEHTLAFLAENYQFVIIDTPPGLAEETCAAIRQSDRLAIVITPELPSLRNAVRAIEYLTGLHYPGDSIDIVLNRYSKRSALSEQEIEDALHREITIKIPNDYALMVNAINAGIPVAGHRSEIPVAFEYWSERLLGGEVPVAASANGSRSWFSLFGS